jgi:hypothetical protein
LVRSRLRRGVAVYRDENWELVFETPAPKGAALLDEDMPGWADKIDLERLDIQLPGDCVLGQLYGTYRAALSVLFGLGEDEYWDSYSTLEKMRRVAAHGFDMLNGDVYEYSFSDLQKEWDFLIEQRRTVDSSD